MKVVLGSLSFLLGFIVAPCLTIILNDVYPWFWLPVLAGASFYAVIALQSWLRNAPFRDPLIFCMSFAALTTYCYSTTPVITRLGSLFPKVWLGLVTLGLMASLVAYFSKSMRIRDLRPASIWLAVPILAALVVGYVSGGIGGANHMHKWITSLLHVNNDEAEIIVHWVRKAIHFTAYGGVGFACFRGATLASANRTGAVTFALCLVACIASFDEMRQTQAVNRTGSFWDVLLDLTGAACFILLAWFVRPNAPRRASVA